MRSWIALSVLIATSSCAGAPVPPPAAPAPPPPASSVTPAPPASQAPKPDPLAAVPPVPATCAVLVQHPVGGTCGSGKSGGFAALDAALAQSDTEQRDARLAGIEACSQFPGGLVRALRAELAPVICSDALVEPVLATATPDTMRRDVRETLEGLRLAGKLSRLVLDVPKLAEPFDKAAFDVFLKTLLKPWIMGQARAIEALSLDGSRLGGYAKGVVAIEAGLADMRFVEVVRSIPLPKEMAGDPQVQDAYYGSLDQELEPRKDRGRDASLVGLREFARAGIIRDARIDRARAVLSKLYGGHRIDALDGLLLPPLDMQEPAALEERLASRVPTFYLPLLVENLDVTKPSVLRALLDRGLPSPMHQALANATLTPEAKALYARILLELGQRYWRSEDLAHAAQVATGGDGKPTETGELISALALALKGGPKDAADMMLRGPVLPEGVGNVSDLDALAKKAKAPISGYAAYDAGFILQLAPPANANKAFWQGVAKRYRQAARQLPSADQRTAATQRAKASEATAAAIR